MSPHSIGKRKEPQRRVLRIGFLISAIGILGCAISSAFAEPDPLEIMRNVVRARGNVTFEADRTVHIINNGKTVRALHQKVYRDTGHKERIETFTSGQSKSHVVVCDGRQMWEYWPSRNLVINHPSAPGGASDGDVQNCINVLYQGMSLAYGGKDTVAQRPVHTVIIRNKNDKLVRKSWIDTGKYVELKTEKYYGGGHPYIRAEVTRIRYHSGLDGTLFDFKAPPQAKTKQVPTPPQRVPLQAAEKAAGFNAVIPANLPDGYVFERDSVAVTRYMDQKTLWLTFTNGLDTFSLFETPCDGQELRQKKTKHTIHQWHAGGLCFTLIGPLSHRQVQKIMNSTQ